MTRDRRRGFTLIELLVVIGVILLLVGIAIIGYQKLDKIAGEKSTQTRLALCASMLSDYETVVTLAGIEGPSPAPYTVGSQIGQPGNVNVGGGGRYGGTVQSTASVLKQMLLVPSTKSMIAQLPGNAMLSVDSGTNGVANGWFDTNGNPIPVVVDAWKNPIIYVPSGGMSGVIIGRQISSATQTNVSAGQTFVVRSIDGRPFWASAGQDGNFQYGDDNLYSCEVVYGH